jgi:hypothetical protein
MADLVKRLRNNCSCNFSSTPCGAEEECRNAFEGADRIEKLEAALRAILDRAEYRMGHHVTDAVCAIAREALEGKDE